MPRAAGNVGVQLRLVADDLVVLSFKDGPGLRYGLRPGVEIARLPEW